MIPKSNICAIINNVGSITFITTSLTGNYRDMKVHDFEDFNFGCRLLQYIINRPVEARSVLCVCNCSDFLGFHKIILCLSNSIGIPFE